MTLFLAAVAAYILAGCVYYGWNEPNNLLDIAFWPMGVAIDFGAWLRRKIRKIP